MDKIDPELADRVYRRLIENISNLKHASDPQKPPSGAQIPQRSYCQGAPIQDSVASQPIVFTALDGSYFPAALALAERWDLLVDGNGVVFTENGNHTTNLRIEWPGYDGWGAQIRTVNYQGEPKGITRGRLAREIARQLERFIERMKAVNIEPNNASYRVGPGGIELRHIRIASLEQVSRGSWQPRLVYSDQ